MTGFYDITTILKNQLILDPFVNTVTEGDIFEVDLGKQTIFPLSHIMVNQATREGHAIRFNVTIMCMDIVDKTKDETTDSFRGNDNEQDVLNTQLAVALRCVEVLDRGDLRESATLDGEVTFEPFTERFENYLAGWSATFDVLVRNTMTSCDSGASLITCPLANYIVEYADGTLIESGTIASGATKTIVVPNCPACDSANWTLLDTDGNVLDSGTIPSGGSANITAPDATYSNSDNSYSGSVLSGGSLSLPDETIIVTDENDNVLDTITFPVYQNQNIDLSSYVTCPSPVGATLMKTGQTTSYRTGDDGDLEVGRATNFTTLASNNPFGNTNRFTDELGGSTYTNNIVIDWSTYDGSTVLGYNRNINNWASSNWDTAINNALAYSIGSFTSGWFLANKKQIENLQNMSIVGAALNYAPFNYNTTASLWSSTTDPDSTTSAFRWNLTQKVLSSLVKTSGTNMRTLAVRTFTVTGTVLS